MVTKANPWHTVDILHTFNYFSVCFLKHFPHIGKRNKEFKLNEASFIMHKVFYLKDFWINLAMFSWASCTVGL